MAPIAVRIHDGHLVALGPADIIRSAYHGTATLTVTSGDAKGDQVKLASKQRYGDHGFEFHPDAYTIEHPRFGTVVAAYVDESAAGLVDAPAIRTIIGRTLRASGDADDRANAEESRIIAEGDQG